MGQVVWFSSQSRKTEEVGTHQVRIVKTVLKWYNVYLNGTDQRINLSPEEFTKHFPHFSCKCMYGCDSVTSDQAVDIGFNVEVSGVVYA